MLCFLFFMELLSYPAWCVGFCKSVGERDVGRINCYLPCSSAPNLTCLRLNASPGGLRTVNAIDAMENSIHPMMQWLQSSRRTLDSAGACYFAPETPDTRAKRRLVLKTGR